MTKKETVHFKQDNKKKVSLSVTSSPPRQAKISSENPVNEGNHEENPAVISSEWCSSQCLQSDVPTLERKKVVLCFSPNLAEQSLADRTA